MIFSSSRMAGAFPGLFLALGLLAAACLATSGCARTAPVSRSDAIRYYLNHRDYEQAIILLRDQVAADPSDDDAKISLASAYSGSVGINTIDCFEVLRPKLFDRPLGQRSLSGSGAESLQDVVPASPPAPLETPEDKQLRALKALESELFKFTSEASDAMDLAFRLPQIAPADRERLVLSITLMSDIREDSSRYLTAQLYRGVLAMVQFMNFFRDAIPPKLKQVPGAPTWYRSLYCQLDLGILLPNLSESINYLNTAFVSLELANRKSDRPLFANLLTAKDKLARVNHVYLQNQDLFQFGDWAQRTSKAGICE